MLRLEQRYLLRKGNVYVVYDDKNYWKIIKDFKSKKIASIYLFVKKMFRRGY
ncbi:hypothetical protein [Francisella marina]|uniref:hypothetical protein n=1 Tax=Francisella marina TaxID=2249302 RepID=UPI00165E24DF|nr:hypothetical protein [Francisella marina]